MKQKIKIISVDFEPEGNLMSQLEKLITRKLAQKWYKQYLIYHNGKDQGVDYLIGYFTNISRRRNLRKWLYNK